MGQQKGQTAKADARTLSAQQMLVCTERPQDGGLQGQGGRSNWQAGPLSRVSRSSAQHDLPPPSCESNTKVPKSNGNTTSCCSDTGVVCAHREKAQEVTDAS